MVAVPSAVSQEATSSVLALNADLYPLYSGVSWGEAHTATEHAVVTIKLLSDPFINITDLSQEFTPFLKYYKDKLTAVSWVEDISQAAAGPGSEVIVFKKGDSTILISYKTLFHTISKDAPEQCPCDLQFELTSK